ncbi:MAG TPA: DUF6191 domain-containing protein [Pseudonocardiaceae bacterium]|jgi:hypothetical protein
MVFLAIGIPVAILLGLSYLIVRHLSGKHTKRSFTEITVSEYTALFYGTKRRELDHRDSWSMMRDGEAQGAPPVDLDGGTWHVARVNEK